MALWQESGSDNASRAREADELTNMLADAEAQMDEKEAKFFRNIYERLEQYAAADGDRTIVSPKQLFWLRDLKDKYL